MISYTNAEIQEIAKINATHHASLLTQCGISLVQAKRLIEATDDMLRKGIEMGKQSLEQAAGTPGEDGIKAIIAAATRELIIRHG